MKKNTDNGSDKAVYVFRPKARLMELLGEQLIKNHNLALFELVKNGYDADASKVEITMLSVDNQAEGVIEVQDDGRGMALDVVTNIWLEPADSHKASFRESGCRTGKDRLPIGEKGVGRFAVHRLGSVIEMVTRAENELEVVVLIDWKKFLDNEYLDQASIDVFERTPKVFTKNETGTRITISELKNTWKRGEIRRLYRSVSSMTPPNLNPEDEPLASIFGTKEIEEKNSFTVDLNFLPKNNWLDGLFDPSKATSNALFVFDFCMSDDGFKYIYRYKPYPAIKAEYPKHIVSRNLPTSWDHIESNFVDIGYESAFYKFENQGLRISKKSKLKKRDKPPKLGNKTTEQPTSLGIGTIKGRILGFDFDKEIYERYIKDETGGLIDYVRDNGGIRVYRDGLRVYNYGEPSDDWLQLDHRRLQSPGKRFGSRQLMGSIYLGLDESNQLKENTNREGFVENDAYEELRHAVVSALNEFEIERNKDKRILKLALRYPPGEVGLVDPETSSNVERLFDDLKKDIQSREEYKPLIQKVNKLNTAYVETRDALMSAAGAGLGLVTVFHELERGVRVLHQSIIGESEPDKIELMSTDLVSLIEGAMYMVSSKQLEIITASKLVNYVLLTQGSRLKKHGITLLNGFSEGKAVDFEIKGVRRILTAVLVNLLDNAIYWADFKGGDDLHIWIGFSNELEGPAIAISDNGGGFRDAPEELVQPFFTRRETGMGIGLYFADMAMKTHAGRLAFPENGTIDVPNNAKGGACVAMVFGSTEK